MEKRSVNTAKELYCGDRYFKEHVMPPDFDWRAHKKELSPYFLKHGFRVSLMYGDFYSRYCGIRSDRYLSMDLYYFYVLPCLNREDMRIAYTDKNMLPVLLPEARPPETVVKNMNGLFYDGAGRGLSRDEAVGRCLGEPRACIVKPAVDSSNGDGVALLDHSSAGAVRAAFAAYRANFIVQRKIEQHPAMSRLNGSSLNTVRLFTYRDVRGKIHVLSGNAFMRVGGRGSVKDNVSSGGCMFRVLEDGRAAGPVCRFKSSAAEPFESCFGVSGFIVPRYEEMRRLAAAWHAGMPYFDFLGWDAAVDAEGGVSLVEMNVWPSVEGPQTVSGPLFGPFLDEVMERVKKVEKETKTFSINSFPNGAGRFLQIG